MFDADRPILRSEQDRLGRTVFAKYLARCILDHDSTDSLVVGLYGGWGTGKTSIINLTLEELRFAASNMLDDEKPIILNFSPWSYSGQNQLIYSFYRRLSSELQRFEYLKNSEKIIHLLELYASFFTHQPVPRSLRKKNKFMTKIMKPRTVKDDAYGWESGRDLTLVKAELNALLRQQKHKIIIFIDNIARLEDHEIKQIFQIVKSMGDYENTVYVLAIDKEHVVREINKLQGSGGEEYLNKIIQMPFEIPPIGYQDLENILLSRLAPLVELAPTNSWDKEYWGDIYYSTLKYLFHNCRDITTYVNALNFSFPRVKDLVNPVDFFAITAIETFAPSVFYGIRDNKDLFTDLMNNVELINQTKLAEDKLRCDEILHRNKNISPDILLSLLIRLFPRLRSIYERFASFYHSEDLARKYRRICSADMFDLYFRLSIPTGYVSEPEMNALLALTNDEQGFALELLRLNQDGRITKFLDSLDSIAEHKAKIVHVGNVISALMDGGDLFPEGESSNLSFNTPMRLHRIFHQLLQRIENTTERFDVFSNAINKTINSLYILVHELTVQSEEHMGDETNAIPVEHRDFTPSQLLALKKFVVEKILAWAENGRLAEHPKLIPILYAWKEWGDEDACRRYVGHMAQDDRGLLAFLTAALKQPIDQAITKLKKSPEWEASLQIINDFIPVKMLEPHAKAVFESLSFEELREREQLAILIFLDLIHAKTTKIMPQTLI